MAISFQTDEYGLLNRWQASMFEDIWMFNQVDNPDGQLGVEVYIQPERERLARGLNNAVRQATQFLGFPPFPVYTVNHVIRLDQSAPWWVQKLELRTRWVDGFGTREMVLVDDSPALLSDAEADTVVGQSYRDFDADGSNEIAWFRLTVPALLEGSDWRYLRAFVREADGAPSPAHRRFQLPIFRYVVSADVLYAGIHRAHLVSPAVWRKPFERREVRNMASRDRAGDFVPSAAFYFERLEKDGAVNLLTMPRDNSTELVETPARAILLPPARRGEFQLLSSANPPGKPLAVRVSYRAGYPLGDDGFPEPFVEDALLALANTDPALRRLPWSKTTANIVATHREKIWQEGFAPPPEYANRLGLLRGHVDASVALREIADALLGKATKWA